MQAGLDVAAPWALALGVGVALLVLFAAGRGGWFNPGELFLLAGPGLDDVFMPVEQHWSTVPILLFRALLHVVGFNFTAFLVVAILVHLVIVVLVWVVMRRVDVRPWLATVTVLPLLVFGPGYLSMIYPIQITQNLSIAAGFGQVLLADHRGANLKRDLLAVLVGAVGLMSSSIMPGIVVGVGLAIVLRRGWRAAAVQTVPLGALFLGWFVWRSPNVPTTFVQYQVDAFGPLDVLRDTARGMWFAAEALGASAPGAVVLVALVIAGLSLRLVEEPVTRAVRAIAVPLGFAASSVVYIGIVAYQRSASPDDYIAWSHHRYNIVALCLPLVGVAGAALIRRWQALAPALAALALIVTVANVRIDDGGRPLSLSTAMRLDARDRLIAAAADPGLDAAAAADPDARVFPDAYTGWVWLTYGQLREFRDAGWVPEP